MSAVQKESSQSDRHSSAMIMFEEVVNKSFEIIKTMLPRLNSLYQLNQELERSVSNIERKLSKLELDNEDLHYEARANKLAVQTKIGNLFAQFNTLSNETSIMKRAESSTRLKTKQIIEKREEDNDSPQVRIGREKDKTQMKRQAEMRKKQTKRRNSIQLIDQPNSGAKVQFNLQSNISIDLSEKNIRFNSQKPQFVSQYNISRKSNLKPNKGQNHCKSSKSIKAKKDERQSENYAVFLREIQNYHFHNQKMKDNYQKLMDQYCQQTNAQLNGLQQKIDKVTTKLEEMDPHHNLLELIQDSSHLQLAKNIQEFKSKLNAKLDSQTFQTVFKDFNSRLGTVHENIRKLANKQETGRAIEFLQNKLSMLFGDLHRERKQKNQSAHMVEVDMKGCLKSVSSNQDHAYDMSEQYSKQTLRNAHAAQNTPRTLRNTNKAKDKRLVTSLHHHIVNGTTPDRNKFNEGRLSLILQRPDKFEEATLRITRESQVRQRQVNLLKQKSAAALQVSKAKLKPRLKKERLIFQYD